MPRLHAAPLVIIAAAYTALAAGGCTARPAAPSWHPTHPSAAGGTDLGPLTDARGRRRSLALAPAGTASAGGFYAARNDAHRTVTAGFRSPTFQTAESFTVDRGPGTGGSFGSRGGQRLRDGVTTRTVRRSSRQVVR